MTVVVVVVVVIINGIFACSDIFSNGKHWATLNVTTYTLIAENLKKNLHIFCARNLQRNFVIAIYQRGFKTY